MSQLREITWDNKAGQWPSRIEIKSGDDQKNQNIRMD